MRVLVTGAGGQLGRSLARALDEHEAVLLPRAALDVTDPDAVAAAVRTVEPDAIVHTAAWTDVDGCEGDPERARLLNVVGTENVIDAAVEAFVVVVSTDYVFDGTSTRPYVEDDLTNPQQVYGQTKLEAELIALASGARVAVARSAWLYGVGTSFVASIIKAAAKRPIDVVDDQVGSPTSTDDLSHALVSLIEHRGDDVFHLVNEGAISRYEFARAIARGAGIDEDRIRAIGTADAPPRPAKRPPYAPLSSDRGPLLAPWDDALARALPDILASL